MSHATPTIVPVVLSGGVGSRLWPLSREQHPKPFLRLADGQSFLQKTYLRGAGLPGVREVVTVTNRDLFFYTKDEYEEVGQGRVPLSFILEPFGRNTAPAVALAAQAIAARHGPGAVMLVLSADHLVQDAPGFAVAVSKAQLLAQAGKLVTFGITPDHPSTAYGYIEAAGTDVLRFVEKPDAATAQAYLESGRFLWNAGMFCFQAGAILDAIAALRPGISAAVESCLAAAATSQGDGWVRTDIRPEDFKEVEDISLDYAVLEHARNLAVVPCAIGWSDIGSWVEFGGLAPPDAQGNHVQGRAVLEDAQDCIVHGEKRVVAALGVKDLIIAETADALLVADRARAQDVRKIVSRLKAQNDPTYQVFPTVHRPWGSYTVLMEGQGFKIKRIVVKPGARLSLQMHRHRSEHWVVVRGQAEITNGEGAELLRANESTYIPAGIKHRLGNPGVDPVVLIEVQCGAYLGEDDIVRFEDVYNRN